MEKHKLDNYDCLYSFNEVNEAIDKMALNIEQKLTNAKPILLCTMIGGIVTTGKLLPRLNFPLQLDYVHASRYVNDVATNKMNWITYPTLPLKDRVVLIVDDILDGGITLAEIIKYCKDQNASEIYSAVLVDKQVPRDKGGHKSADFVGISVPDRYVFGCGMDYDGYLRNAPGIYAVPLA